MKRVILPGAQALMGFQLVIVVTSTFEKLPDFSRLLHGIALFTGVFLVSGPGDRTRLVVGRHRLGKPAFGQITCRLPLLWPIGDVNPKNGGVKTLHANGSDSRSAVAITTTGWSGKDAGAAMTFLAITAAGNRSYR